MKTMIQAAVFTLFAASTVHAQQAVQWRVEDGGNGHWYLVTAAPFPNWASARAAAEAAGGHLATIGSAAEWQFVRPRGVGCYVGGYQDPTANGWYEPAGGWRWVTDEPWSVGSWSGFAPDDAPCHVTAGDGTQDVLWIAFQSKGILDDIESMPVSYCQYSLSKPAVFEWSADCNGDGVVDYGQCRDGTLPDYDSGNIPDCCESGTPCVIGSYPLQWRTSDGGNGHWYQVVIGMTDQSWEASRIAAGSRGGYLATLTSEAENQWLHAVAVRHPSAFQNHGPWLGGYRSGSDWRWITDEAWLFAAWTPDNPSGDGVAMGYWEISNPAAESWNDAPESNHMISFVAEWSADCNSDGIVDYGQILQGQLADANADGIPDICQAPTCVDADLFRDFNVDGADLGILLAQWGPNTPLTVSDINDDGIVDGADLGFLLSVWGKCP